MRSLGKLAVIALVLIPTLIAFVASGRGRPLDERAGAQEFQKVFGTPPAEVFKDDYSGPPVVGEYVTLAPNVAPLPGGNRTHQVRVDVVAQQIEVGPGVRYNAWTFGGTVPGPVLHVRQGDRVVFTMKNRSAESVAITAPEKGGSPFLEQVAALKGRVPQPIVSPMHHSIDFHAATVAGNDKWRTINPGDAIRFEWVANYPGVFTYHCGTPPVLQHIAMGQYGIVIVSPRDGFPTDSEVDREYAVVQSEFYLKPGKAGLHDLDYEAALKKLPMIVAFNGHQTSLMDAPLTAAVGERVRLYVHNVGPSDGASTHVIGTIFDRVYYEGNPANDWRGMQTVALGASNGAVIELIIPEDGEYAIVDHEFADAAKGAVGKIVTPGAKRLTMAGH